VLKYLFRPGFFRTHCRASTLLQIPYRGRAGRDKKEKVMEGAKGMMNRRGKWETREKRRKEG